MVIKKLLIANRGEVAVRIARACAEMGIRSVAIYTEPDRHALHVKKANEAYHVGADPLLGYLNPHTVVNLAVAAGADALHPGYGFLAENPLLPEICAKRGIGFVGPSAKAVRHMGSKVLARRAMKKAGVPVIPGSDESLKNLDEARRLAQHIGYPVMLKATMGGGGRGIRRCENERDLLQAYPRVMSEAQKSFGSPEIFIEKCVDNPRHIEVQILADSYGKVVHLFERDCSLQRRHQKLVEIAPSPQLSSREQESLAALAVRAAQEVGYESAGTVEFLRDGEGNFYFLEMNTRLQVEHAVTEIITGIDIVQEQIRIAAGEPLSFSQEDITKRGFAIEFRINAEDPKNQFLPKFGRITRYYAPGGPGVRVDSAIYTGYEVPPYYDSMLVKVVVWALTWPAVLARSARALADMRLSGVKTTIPYYLEILKHPSFRRGAFGTDFVDACPELLEYVTPRPPEDLAAAVGALIAAQSGL